MNCYHDVINLTESPSKNNFLVWQNIIEHEKNLQSVMIIPRDSQYATSFVVRTVPLSVKYHFKLLIDERHIYCCKKFVILMLDYFFMVKLIDLSSICDDQDRFFLF